MKDKHYHIKSKEKGNYGEGNYGESNEKDVYNIIRRRREKLGTRRGEEENAGEKNRLPQNLVTVNVTGASPVFT